MINYADYDFYEDEYKGSLSEDLFDSLIIKASREIDNNINCVLDENKINTLTEREQWQLSYCSCKLVDFLNSDLVKNEFIGLSSISIDGVNKTYKGKEESNNQIKNNLKEILEYLPECLTRYN